MFLCNFYDIDKMICYNIYLNRNDKTFKLLIEGNVMKDSMLQHIEKYYLNIYKTLKICSILLGEINTMCEYFIFYGDQMKIKQVRTC